MRVVSFDVFDTLVTRTFATAKDLFVELGVEAVAKGFVKLAPEEFARRRVSAELCARQSVAGHEVRHPEIYKVLQKSLALDDHAADQLRTMELNLETLALQPVPRMLERVKHERAQVDLVLFVSDMYLPPEFVEDLLTRFGFFQEGDRLYLSGEARASKASGTLFRHIRQDLPAPPNPWKHIGDNERADLVSRAGKVSTRSLSQPHGLTAMNCWRVVRKILSIRGGHVWQGPCDWRGWPFREQRANSKSSGNAGALSLVHYGLLSLSGAWTKRRSEA